MKVCAEPGCPKIQQTTRCAEHARAKDRARGSRIERGYDAQHFARRRHYKRRMEAGEVFTCWRCGLRINPLKPWDLGHDDHDRTKYRGPEHPSCNRATSARRAAI